MPARKCAGALAGESSERRSRPRTTESEREPGRRSPSPPAACPGPRRVAPSSPGGTRVERRFDVDPELYPFESHWHPVGDSALHYLDEGDGPTVVLLHGNPTWSFSYRAVVRQLAQRCRCIVPDYPGFGLSGHPTGYAYSPAEHAAAIGGLLDALGLERVHLVVQDWGGPIGMAVATEQPDRIAGFVIANTWCWEPTPSMWLFSKLLGGAVGRYWILQHNLFADTLLRGSLAEATDRRVLDAYTAPFPDAASRIGTWRFPGAITRDQTWIRRIERHLGAVGDRPAELLWGERDLLFSKPGFEARWSRHFPDSASERIPDAGHVVQEERPDRVAAAVLRLLDRTGD